MLPRLLKFWVQVSFLPLLLKFSSKWEDKSCCGVTVPGLWWVSQRCVSERTPSYAVWDLLPHNTAWRVLGAERNQRRWEAAELMWCLGATGWDRALIQAFVSFHKRE